MGLSAEVNIACEDYPIWPHHRRALAVFLACATQWNVHVGMAVWWQGLEYCRVESTLRLMGIRRRRWPHLFAQVRVMERAAQAALAAEKT